MQQLPVFSAQSYRRPGLQTIARSLASKISESGISLEDFGAVANGVNDCSPAMTAALAEMSLGTIGDRERRLPIVLNAGQYRFASPIAISVADFAMTGAGPELTSLLIDHTSGHGISYTGLGNAAFEGFALYASDTRNAAGASDSLSGFVSDPGVSGTTLMLRLRNVYSYRHPGKGICLINPEQAFVEGCRAANNKGKGLHMWGRDLANILNEVTRFRARDNGAEGLHWQNLDSGGMTACEALNNGQGVSAGYQMRVDGACNEIRRPDCEMFDHVTSGTDYRGLLLTGRGNKVTQGQFYGLNSGVHCVDAKASIIEQVKLEGKSGADMATGILLDANSGGSTVSIGQKNLVTTAVTDNSEGSTTIPYVA